MPSTPEPPVSDAEFDEYERADPGPSEAEEKYVAQQQRYYARLRARVREPSNATFVELVHLINRVGRRLRLEELGAPPVIMDREKSLIEKALDTLDPYWRTHGLSPEDWQAYQAATDERNAVLYDNLANDRASRADATSRADARTPAERADDNPV